MHNLIHLDVTVSWYYMALNFRFFFAEYCNTMICLLSRMIWYCSVMSQELAGWLTGFTGNHTLRSTEFLIQEEATLVTHKIHSKELRWDTFFVQPVELFWNTVLFNGAVILNCFGAITPPHISPPLLLWLEGELITVNRTIRSQKWANSAFWSNPLYLNIRILKRPQRIVAYFLLR